jgi:hypothetical protein
MAINNSAIEKPETALCFLVFFILF